MPEPDRPLAYKLTHPNGEIEYLITPEGARKWHREHPGLLNSVNKPRPAHRPLSGYTMGGRIDG